jgi:hypothetical protein
MSAYEKSNDHWHGALLVFDHLMCSFLEVDLVARNAIISACTEVWQIALALFSGSDHCDEISFNALLGACCVFKRRKNSTKLEGMCKATDMRFSAAYSSLADFPSNCV